jgi:predicted enzyme related to lactoylglutathione lyase
MLYVKDFPGMRAFYSKLLDAKPVNSKWTDAWARFDLGGTSFALHAIPPDIAQHSQASPAPLENSPIKLIFQVDNLAEERRRLESLGIATIQRPWQDPSESFEAVDPEGNIFQISAGLKD